VPQCRPGLDRETERIARFEGCIFFKTTNVIATGSCPCVTARCHPKEPVLLFFLPQCSLPFSMAFDKILLRELEAGASRFSGTDIDLQVPLSDGFVGRIVKGPRITFHPDNRVRVKYGVFPSVTGVIDEFVDLENACIRITIEGLAGVIVGLGKRANLKFLQFHGSVVTVLLNQIPALQPLLRNKRYIHSIRLETVESGIWIFGKVCYPGVLAPATR
jgi:hypothetical protein